MASQWFVRSSDSVDGPYTARQLRKLVEQGRIAPETEIRNGTDASWTIAAKVKGLLLQPRVADARLELARPRAPQVITEGDGGVPKWLWALIGVAVLVIGGVGFLLYSDMTRRADERRIVAAQHEAAGYIEEAKSKMAKGHLDRAEELLQKALSVEGASDTTTAQTTLAQVTKARVIARAKELFDRARSDISSHKIPAAIETLKELAKIVGSPMDIHIAGKQLLDEAMLSTSLERAINILAGLSDSQFEEFLTSRELPAEFKLKDAVLDETFRKTCDTAKIEAQRERENHKKHEIEVAQIEARRRNSGKELCRLEGHISSHDLYSAMSKDHRLMAFRVESSIYLWNLDQGREITVLNVPPGNELAISSPLAFSPDSRLLAAIAEAEDKKSLLRSEKIILWDTESQKVAREYLHEKNSEDYSEFFHHPLALTSTDMIIECSKVSGGRGVFDSSLQVINLQTSQVARSFSAYKGSIDCIALSPDDRFAVIGGEQRVAILWELQSGREVRLFDAHQDRISCAAFSPDGRLLLTGSKDCSVRLWQVATGRELYRWAFGPYDARKAAKEKLEGSLAEMQGKILMRNFIETEPYVVSVAFSPSGELALVGLYVLNPLSMTYPSNPVLIDMATRKVIDLPLIFQSAKLTRVWAAFARDGSAAFFNRARTERIRGEDVRTEYFSVVGLP